METGGRGVCARSQRLPMATRDTREDTGTPGASVGLQDNPLNGALSGTLGVEATAHCTSARELPVRASWSDVRSVT